MEEKHSRPIRAEAFSVALIEAGIISAGDKVRRIVIDAQAGCAVTMHVERFADERLLSVAMTLDGVEVKTGTPVPDA